MDAGFKCRPFSSLTLQELRDRSSAAPEGIRRQMESEIERLEAVERGDYTNATAAERMRAIKEGTVIRFEGREGAWIAVTEVR
jgi:hypothetical protein